MTFENLVKNIKPLSDINPELCQTLRKYCFPLLGCCQEVHREMGPFLNEYLYQDALEISFHHAAIPFIREYSFKVRFMNEELNHTHRVDFFVQDKVFVECKAVDTIGKEHRQQLWNYMRLTGVTIGILYNFAPYKDQCERYYLDVSHKTIYAF